MRKYETFLIGKHGKDARAISLYTSSIAAIHAEARKLYNDNETGELLIKNPFEFYTPPKQKPAQKAAVEQKDDGTCWAVTEAGTRCKHKKDGESDYCKQHAVNVKPSEPVTQCRAMTYEGTQCTRKPEEGKRYCKQHMGK